MFTYTPQSSLLNSLFTSYIQLKKGWGEDPTLCRVGYVGEVVSKLLHIT
jgi:hypothetical protein